ncbi:HPP family protein [Viridothelium virens]|uniref:HPP family protein n=1 Tax=Viridothelium virens TaxID=1048519 RepID=A0A6A6H8L6_VIRVR|nr:HPP family protein [Viridothelium virens]
MPQVTNCLACLPPWASRWLGHRSNPPSTLPPYLVYLWSFLGAFCGLSTIQVIFKYSSYFQARNVPLILPSYGASAVLVYGVPDAPLSQPRALVGGHFLSALIGICVTKLFSLIPPESQFQSLRWLSASLSTSISIVVMQMTKTVHPPAGATALLPAVDDQVWDLSWYFLPIVLLSSTVALVVGLVVNNVQRQYPVFWFAPAGPGPVPLEPVSLSQEMDAPALTKTHSADGSQEV